MSYGELNWLHFSVDVLGRFLWRIRRVVVSASMVLTREISTTTFFPNLENTHTRCSQATRNSKEPMLTAALNPWVFHSKESQA